LSPVLCDIVLRHRLLNARPRLYRCSTGKKDAILPL